MSRVYTVDEILRMRHAVQRLELGAAPYDFGVHVRSVEAHLQTYIFAQVQPHELEDAAKRLDATYQRLPPQHPESTQRISPAPNAPFPW